ncbi:hypothetical protein [Xanthomonas sp. CFBP 8445]|uniref:hypothetical protein n=1 Tax=Xanthomonas sp. CFBP 8445 TaxID=2971236 RepID=UPI0021E0AD50|nr:hypothetical protein [Xanthomonas sp. CFBP 8445]UYC14010.1 hypothetical protein NUG21_09905 [Xanthomonas sp. CFBP 8445]
MSHEILSVQLAIAGVLAVALLIRGYFAYARWFDRRIDQQLEADFRAYCMVQEAKREAARRA